jgi:hypothetical protein
MKLVRIPALFAAVLVLYVVSIGPVYRITWTPVPKPAGRVAAFYAPLDWVCGQSPALEKALYDYVDLWLPPRPAFAFPN